ncbi:MAG: 2-oxoisovalerate dehydrogenase [Dehalococcoidia bacterium]
MSETQSAFTVQESSGGGYEARAIVTQADTLEEPREMTGDAFGCHYDDTDRPSAIALRAASASPD